MDFWIYISISHYLVQKKLLTPLMDDEESNCFLLKIMQNKNLLLKYFNFVHNHNILLQKEGMAICFSVA